MAKTRAETDAALDEFQADLARMIQDTDEVYLMEEFAGLAGVIEERAALADRATSATACSAGCGMPGSCRATTSPAASKRPRQRQRATRVPLAVGSRRQPAGDRPSYAVRGHLMPRSHLRPESTSRGV